MIYEKNKDNAVYIYNVTYDKEKLKELLKRLEKYSYVLIRQEYMGGSMITRWPATKKNVQKRVAALFYGRKCHSNDILHPETIVHHTENNYNFVTYEYSSLKLPDLYHYIDIIVNNREIINYEDLFGYVTGKLNMFYAIKHKEQLLIEGILNYINSPELSNHNNANNLESSDKNYDYKGLNELYKETLECFKFNLIAIKEYIENQEVISGLSFQKTK